MKATIEVIERRRQEDVVTVRVNSGFGDPEIQFHADQIDLHTKTDVAGGPRPPWTEAKYTPTAWIVARLLVAPFGWAIKGAAYYSIVAGFYLAAPIDLFRSDSYGEYMWRRHFGREAIDAAWGLR